MKEMCNQESENSASPVLRVRPLTGASGAGGSATERRLGGIPTMLITSFTWTGSNLHTTRKHIKHKHTKPRTLVSLVFRRGRQRQQKQLWETFFRPKEEIGSQKTIAL